MIAAPQKPKYSNIPKRPVDKLNILNAQGVTNTQANGVLRTSASAETYNGGYIDGTIVSNGAAGVSMLVALCYVKDGQAVPTMSLASGAQLKPETSVLWWKLYVLPGGGIVLPLNDGGSVQVKSKRKMMTGDQLVWVTLGSAATTAQLYTNHTHFFKI